MAHAMATRGCSAGYRASKAASGLFQRPTAINAISSSQHPPRLPAATKQAHTRRQHRPYSDHKSAMAAHPPKPVKYAVALFHGFQSLDVFGPVDALHFLSHQEHIELALVGPSLDPVSTLHDAPRGWVGGQIVPTHTFATAPDDIDVLLVPGGAGTRDRANTRQVVDFVRQRYPTLKYLLTVCTGSAVAARAGVLDGKRATSNKRSFEWAASQGPDVIWQPKARWVEDGNVWTSSGVSAGIDMMFAFIEARYGRDVADDVASRSEYVRSRDPNNDPFAGDDA